MPPQHCRRAARTPSTRRVHPPAAAAGAAEETPRPAAPTALAATRHARCCAQAPNARLTAAGVHRDVSLSVGKRDRGRARHRRRLRERVRAVQRRTRTTTACATPVNGDSIWNGADDNATVSVALLAIGARVREASGAAPGAVRLARCGGARAARLALVRRCIPTVPQSADRRRAERRHDRPQQSGQRRAARRAAAAPQLERARGRWRSRANDERHAASSSTRCGTSRRTSGGLVLPQRSPAVRARGHSGDHVQHAACTPTTTRRATSRRASTSRS